MIASIPARTISWVDPVPHAGIPVEEELCDKAVRFYNVRPALTTSGLSRL